MYISTSRPPTPPNEQRDKTALLSQALALCACLSALAAPSPAHLAYHVPFIFQLSSAVFGFQSQAFFSICYAWVCSLDHFIFRIAFPPFALLGAAFAFVCIKKASRSLTAALSISCHCTQSWIVHTHSKNLKISTYLLSCDRRSLFLFPVSLRYGRRSSMRNRGAASACEPPRRARPTFGCSDPQVTLPRRATLEWQVALLC